MTRASRKTPIMANIERAGVLIEDPTFASRLSEQWLSLVPGGQMKPYTVEQ